MVRKVGERSFAHVSGWLATRWMEEAGLTNQMSEELSGKSRVKYCRTDPQ